MPSPDLCSDAEITHFVHSFYAKVRSDGQLGPIFEQHIDDWDAHLLKLVDFWSSVLRGSGRFSGAPMPKHAALPGLSAALFQHWLALFEAVMNAQPNQAMAKQAMVAARRIANSLWMGYQMSQHPDKLPRDLGHV